MFPFKFLYEDMQMKNVCLFYLTNRIQYENEECLSNKDKHSSFVYLHIEFCLSNKKDKHS